MESKNALAFIKIIENLVQAYVERWVDLTRLASLEARLAGRALVSLSILYAIFGFLLFSGWLCTLTLLFIGLASIQHNWLFASIVIILINLSLLAMVAFLISKKRKDISFSATRRQFHNKVKLINKRKPHGRAKTTN